jgi:hypothetical protein
MVVVSNGPPVRAALAWRFPLFLEHAGSRLPVAAASPKPAAPRSSVRRLTWLSSLLSI